MTIRIVIVAALAVLAAASAQAAAPPEEQAVLAPVHAMFAGMAKYDQAAMLATVQPEGSVALLRDGTVKRMTLGEFVSHVKPGKGRIEERIHDPLVRVDGDLAMVWAPYEFLVDGKVHHCGSDLIHLVRTNGRWLIAGVADNSRTDCAAK